jgi:hypothetical protein
MPPEYAPPGEEDLQGTEEEEPKTLQWSEPRTEAGRQGMEFLQRMREIAAARSQKNRESVASQWAELRRWCLERDMLLDARMCELRASLLAADNEKVAQMLGRQAEFAGVRVSSEQAEFLRMSRPVIELRNHHMRFEKLSAGMSEQDTRRVSCGAQVELRADAGNGVLLLSMENGDEQTEARVPLMLKNGTRHRLDLVSGELLPTVLTPPLKALRRALEEWNEYQDPDHPWPDEALQQRKGWEKIEGGWNAPVDRMRVQFFISGPQDLSEIQIADVRLSQIDEREPSVLLRSGAYRVVGRLETFDWQKRPVTVVSSSNRPAIVQPIRANNWGRLWNGRWEFQGEKVRYRIAKFRGKKGPIFSFRYSETPVEPVRRIMDLQSQRHAQSSEILRLSSKMVRLRRESVRREITGELLGNWQTELWLYEHVTPAMREQWLLGRFLNEARGNPVHVGTAGQYGTPEPDDAGFLDWCLFRNAVVPMASRFAAGAEQPMVRLELIPLMETEAALRTIREGWDDFTVQERVRAIRGLRWSIDPEVERFLADKVQNDHEAEVRRQSLVVLGEIGTRSALETCRAPAIEPVIRAASNAALAGAGDPETLETLSKELESASEEERSVFLKELLRMRTPTVLLGVRNAMRTHTDAASTESFAGILSSMQGRGAAALLAQLMRAHGRPYIAACAKFASSDMTPLVGPLAEELSGGEQACEAASVLGKSRNQSAIEALREAVEKNQPAAVVGLAVSGAPELLDAAAAGADVIGPQHIDFIGSDWRGEDGSDGEFSWRSKVDSEAATRFLRAVLEQAKDPLARLNAARFMIGTGEEPSAQALLNLAAMPVPGGEKEDAPQGDGREGPPVGGPPPGMPDDYYARRREPSRQDEKADEDVETNSQVKALEILASIGPGPVTNGLLSLVQETDSMAVKEAALRALGRCQNDRANQFLDQTAGKKGELETLDELTVRARLRVAAAQGLAAAAHPASVTHLHDLWFNAPAGLEALRELNEEGFGAAWGKRQKLVRKGVCEAVMAVPPQRTLLQMAGDKKAARELLDELIRIAERGAMAGESEMQTAVSPALAVRCLGQQTDLDRAGWQLFRQLQEHWERLSSELQQAVLTSLSKNDAPAATDLLHDLLAGQARSEEDDDGDERPMPRRFARPEEPARRGEGEQKESRYSEVLLALAARGKKADYELLAKTVSSMGSSTARAVAETLLGRDRADSEPYYEVLARAAARPLEVDRLAPLQFYRQALGLETQPEEPEEETRRGRYPERRGYSATARRRSESENERRASVRPDRLPESPWFSELAFRARCLQALQNGPDIIVGPVLNEADLRLLEHPVFGPASAWIAGRKAPEFQLLPYLKKRYLAEISERDRQSVTLCAIREGGKDSEKLLQSILLGQLQEEDQVEEDEDRMEERGRQYRRDGRPRRDSRGTRERERLFEPSQWSDTDRLEGRRRQPPGRDEEGETQPSAEESEVATMRHVGRGLGYFDRYYVLRQAINYRKLRNRVVYMHPLERRLGAITGLAWLPAGDDPDPATRLRGFARSLPEPDMKAACARAVLNYYRLQAAGIRSN